MKFSVLLALALTYTTLASAQSQDFRSANADKAEQLTKEFAKLNKDSPCQENTEACVEDQFAQCVGGKFVLNSCGGGNLKCVVLPLVNKPGTSITCDTEQDRLARLADARGQNNSNPATPSDNNPATPSDNNPATSTPSDNNPATSTPSDNNPATPSDNQTPDNNGNASPDQGKGKGKGKGKTCNCPPNKPCKCNNQDNNNNNNNNNNDNGKGKDGNTSPNNQTTPDSQTPSNGLSPSDVQTPSNDLKTPPANGGGSLADIRKQNAADAEALQNKFDSLKATDKCTENEVACVEKKFAQCTGGKFVLTECAAGTTCAALPLVLKKGTTVACTTEADRQARLQQAKTNTK